MDEAGAVQRMQRAGRIFGCRPVPDARNHRAVVRHRLERGDLAAGVRPQRPPWIAREHQRHVDPEQGQHLEADPARADAGVPRDSRSR